MKANIYNGHEWNIESVNPLSIMFWGYIDGELKITSTNYNTCLDRLKEEIDIINSNNLL